MTPEHIVLEENEGNPNRRKADGNVTSENVIVRIGF